MADKIRGITIELGGDTTGLSKALKEVNSEISGTQKQLKDVEKLLKLDPGNTELLAQKQDLLKKAIGETADKLDTLKKAEQQLKDAGIDENSEQFMALRREVISTENSMSGLKDQLKATNNQLDGKTSEEVKEIGDESEKAEPKLQKLGSAAKAVGSAMAAAFAAASAAVAKVGSELISAAQEGAAYADNILTESTVTGIATDKLQEYQYASELVDVSLETLTGSMAKNIKSMTNAANGSATYADAYAKLGVAVTDASGNLRDSETVYWELIDALGNVEDETERDSLAMTVLGKSAQDLNPLITAGAERMAELGQQAQEAGYVLSDDALDAFGAFDDQLQYLNVGAEAAKNALGTVLLPVLTDLAGEGVDLLGEFTNGILDANGDISKMGEVIDAVLPQALDAIMEYIPQVIDLVMSIMGAIGTAVLDNLPIIIDSAASIAQTLFDGLIGALPQILDASIQLIMTLANGLIDNLPQIVEAAIQVIGSLVLGIAEALPELIPAAVDAVLTIADALVDNIDLLVDAALLLTIGLAEGLIDALPQLLEKAPVIIENLVDAIIDNLPKIVGVAWDLLKALAKGIVENLPLLLESAAEIIFKIAEGIALALEQLVRKGREIVDSVKKGFQEKVDNAKQWGKDLISNFIDGLKEKWDNLKTTVSNVAGSIKSFLGFSEPEEGPLSDFHTFAPDMMDLFIKGIRDNTQRLRDQLEKSFDVSSLGANVAISGNYAGMSESGAAMLTYGGQSPATASSGSATLSIPLTLDGQVLANAVAKLQWLQGTATVRNLGTAY